jgi:hypothetical protein
MTLICDDYTVGGICMNMRQWWNNTDRGTMGKLVQCHFANHKSCMDWQGIELRPAW